MNATALAADLVRLANQRDLDGAVSLFHPQAELCFPRFAPRRVYRGATELTEFFAWVLESLPLQTFAADRIVGTETTAIVEMEIAATSRRGHDVDNVAAMVVDAEDGVITSVRLYVDTADLGRVLGLDIVA